MEDRFLRMEDKIDKLIEKTGGVEEQFKAMNGTVRELKKKDIIHDGKFEKLNEFKNQIKGGLLVLSFIITLIGIKIFLI